MKEIKSTQIKDMFTEMNKDFPQLFNTHSTDGKAFITKYHEMVYEYDNLFYNCILAMKAVLVTNPELCVISELVKNYESKQNEKS